MYCVLRKVNLSYFKVIESTRTDDENESYNIIINIINNNKHKAHIVRVSLFYNYTKMMKILPQCLDLSSNEYMQAHLKR